MMLNGVAILLSARLLFYAHPAHRTNCQRKDLWYFHYFRGIPRLMVRDLKTQKLMHALKRLGVLGGYAEACAAFRVLHVVLNGRAKPLHLLRARRSEEHTSELQSQ